MISKHSILIFPTLIILIFTISICSQATSVNTVVAKSVTYIKGLQNADGGWALMKGKESGILETALAIQALLFSGEGSGSAIIRRGINYLLNKQTKDGDWNENPAHTVLAIAVLRTARASDETLYRGLRWLKKKGQNQTDGSWADNIGDEGTTWQTGMVLTGMGRIGLGTRYTPAENGMKWLADIRNEDSGWGTTKGKPSNVHATAWAILGLSIAMEDYIYEVEEAIDWLKERQNADGGFGINKGKPSNPELTAYAIIALVNGNDMSNATGKAIRYLIKAQQKDGGYTSATPAKLKEPTNNLQTTCFVLWAILAETIKRKR